MWHRIHSWWTGHECEVREVTEDMIEEIMEVTGNARKPGINIYPGSQATQEIKDVAFEMCRIAAQSPSIQQVFWPAQFLIEGASSDLKVDALMYLLGERQAVVFVQIHPDGDEVTLHSIEDFCDLSDHLGLPAEVSFKFVLRNKYLTPQPPPLPRPERKIVYKNGKFTYNY